MAEADVKLPNGTTAKIKGTVDEIARIMGLCNSGIENLPEAATPLAKLAKDDKRKKEGPYTLIQDLKKSGFFKTSRSLTEIQKKLEIEGHIYAKTSMSSPLKRLVQERILGRVDQKGIYYYVHR